MSVGKMSADVDALKSPPETGSSVSTSEVSFTSEDIYNFTEVYLKKIVFQ